MLTATIHVDLDSDYVLSDLKAIHDEPFTIYQFEIIDGEIIKFVINAGDHRDAIATSSARAMRSRHSNTLPTPSCSSPNARRVFFQLSAKTTVCSGE